MGQKRLVDYVDCKGSLFHGLEYFCQWQGQDLPAGLTGSWGRWPQVEKPGWQATQNSSMHQAP